jgi:hypothetical protein
MYCSDAGLNWLDVIDYYINFVMTLVGFMEVFGAGWMYGMEETVKNVGEKAVYSWMLLANFGPVCIACAIWYGDTSDTKLVGLLVGIFCAIVGSGVTHMYLMQVIEANPGKWTTQSIWWEVSFANIFALRDRVQPTVQYIPDGWAYLIKGFIPHVLIIVFVNAAASKNPDGETTFWHYGGYASYPYQALGVVCVLFTLFLFVLGFVWPEVYAPLATASEGDNKEAEGKGAKAIEMNMNI